MKKLSTLIALSALLLCSACAVSPSAGGNSSWMSSVPQTASADTIFLPKN